MVVAAWKTHKPANLCLAVKACPLPTLNYLLTLPQPFYNLSSAQELS